MRLDPEITVKQALELTNGNQAELARRLGIQRAAVNEWVTTHRKLLPELQAHRLVRLYPAIFGDAA